MAHRRICLTGLATLLVMGTGSWASCSEGRSESQERGVTLDQIPTWVKVTLQKAAGKSEILEIEEVMDGERMFYEATWMKEGREVEVKISPDGKLLSTEVEEQRGEARSESAEEDEEGEVRDEDEEEAEGDEDVDDEEEAEDEGDSLAQEQVESERAVNANEVAKAALQALRKLAAGAEITEFAEEIEHGSTFYEGSWKAPSGRNLDVLVTAAGALVEMEETISPDQAPRAVLRAIRRAAGRRTSFSVERKTMILYEAKYRTEDGLQELLLTPDGRKYVEASQQRGTEKEEEEREEE